MLSRAFAVACDGGYFPGLRALLNSIWVYHRREVPVLLFHRGLSDAQLGELKAHPADLRLYHVADLAFPSPGMWEAKQQVFAHCITLARCVYLLDADLVLVSSVGDIFELAELGRIVSSADGPGACYDAEYSVYSPRLPGSRQPYINTGALCLDVVRHWDLAGLWAFASRYGAYSPRAGAPLGLPGHGDQGVFNAVAAVLAKASDFHVLPEGTWCDSQRGCTVQIRATLPDGPLEVWNLTDNARQRLVHSSGPKWWTPAGEAHLTRFGDKFRCFQHFASLMATRPKRILIGVCSSRKTVDRRAVVRETWMKQLPPQVQAVFFVGEGAGTGEADLVELAVPDDYGSLPRKIQEFMRHALEQHEFDYLFKCDDDTYVVPERLATLAAGDAAFVGSSASAPHGYASGGAGYLLSRAAVRTVVEVPRPGPGAEDVWITGVLRAAGIPLTPSEGLRPGHDQLPDRGNTLVTAHYCGPETMSVVHRLMTSETEQMRILVTVFARHTHWQGPVKLLSDGTFLGGAAAPDGRWEWNGEEQSLHLRWFHWPADRLQLRDRGLEAANLRLEFTAGTDRTSWLRAMAEPVIAPTHHPSVLVHYNGRLGNRLFQFAAGWALSRHFGVPLHAEPLAGFPATRDFNHARRPVLPLETNIRDDMRIDFEECGRHLRRGGEIIVNGYHQRYEIFRPCKEPLKAVLSSMALPIPRCLPASDDLVVHLRLTDYFSPEKSALFAYSLEDTLEVVLRQRFERLFVVTDEPTHPVVQRLRAERGAILGETDALADFAVMLAAKRLVMTPSTFSWWAGWLGEAEEVYFPRQRGIWRNHRGIDLWVNDENRYRAY